MKMRRHKYVGHPGDRPLDAEARAASDYFDMTEDENEDSDPTDNGDISNLYSNSRNLVQSRGSEMSVTPTDMALLRELDEGCTCDDELCRCSISPLPQ